MLPKVIREYIFKGGLFALTCFCKQYPLFFKRWPSCSWQHIGTYISRSVGIHEVVDLGRRKCNAVDPDMTALQAAKVKVRYSPPSKNSLDSMHILLHRYHCAFPAVYFNMQLMATMVFKSQRSNIISTISMVERSFDAGVNNLYGTQEIMVFITMVCPHVLL